MSNLCCCTNTLDFRGQLNRSLDLFKSWKKKKKKIIQITILLDSKKDDYILAQIYKFKSSLIENISLNYQDPEKLKQCVCVMLQ